MTNPRPIHAHLTVQLPEPGAPAHLVEALARSGVVLEGAPDPHAPAINGASPRVVVFDGRLTREHGPLLRGGESSFLLACQPEAGPPHPGDVEMLAQLLQRSSVSPDFEGVQRYYVGTLPGLRTASERVHAFLEGLDVPRTAAEACADVLYELAANALLDAPAGRDGVPLYAHRRDEPGLRISPEDAAVVAFGIKGNRAVLAAVDRFGRLTAEPLARTLEGLGTRAKVNGTGGGAGLGLRRIVEQSDLIAVRVVPGRVTEVVCTVDLREVRRRAAGPKSLFFSVERG